MKKQLLVSGLIATTILGSTTAFILNNASAETNNTNTTNSTSLITAEDSVASLTTPAFNSKDETVFVITDANGQEKSKFIGSTLYTGTESLPFDFKVTYLLDGEEISPSDLAGKSGHVKITFKATSITKYQNQYIPFITVTGMTLDRSIFSNVKIESGKIISESTDSYIIAGYALTGLNEDLGTDFLPDNFSIEADTTNFKLSNTYTILLNEIIADFDTSKLTTVDNLASSVYQLSDGLNQIISGTSTLSNGIKQLSDGLNQIVAHNSELQYGANTVIDTILGVANDALEALHSLGVATEYDEITVKNYQAVFDGLSAKVAEYRSEVEEYLGDSPLSEEKKAAILGLFDTTIKTLTGAKNIITLNSGVISYTDAVATAANGASQLYSGSVTLKNGLITFKTAGIDKLVSFAEKDLAGFTKNARSTIAAASSYKNFDNKNAKSVKFIIKTQSI